MVTMKQILNLFLVWGLLLVAGLQTAHADSLKASVDRTEIGINESVQLSVTGTMDVNFSFNIFDLRLPSPDLAALESDFEIADQRQRYNFQSINGQNQATVTWSYTLIPRRTGDLTIPALKFRDVESSPIEIQVTDSPGTSQARDSVFLEAEVSKSEVFVQEQFIYSLRLNYQDDILGGDLSEPELPDAVVRQIDKQKEYSRTLDGRRYQVIERRYLVIPQKSGTLTIEPQMFTGTLYDSRIRNRRLARASSDAVTVEVTPPPASTGDTWLPAMSLSLTEHWSRSPDELEAGDSITRTLTIKALGLEGSQLPPLPRHDTPQLKQYPEQPQIDTETHADGVTGTRIERTAVVAVQGGEAHLPEIRLPWYDTLNQEWRTAVVPARTIKVKGAAVSEPAPETQPSATAGRDATESADTGTAPLPEPGDSDAGLMWKLVSLGLLLLWLATLVAAFLWRRRKPQTETARSSGVTEEQEAFRRLRDLAAQDWRSVRPALLEWARRYWPRHQIHSLAELIETAGSASLSAAIKRQEQAHYSVHQSDAASTADIIEEVQRIRDGGLQGKAEPAGELAELYPASTQ